jgi:hypothetical protein
MKQFLVFVEEGLALSGVGNQEGRAGLELDGGWKASAAGPNNAEFLNPVERGSGCGGCCRHFAAQSSKTTKVVIDSSKECIVSFNFNQDLSK